MKKIICTFISVSFLSVVAVVSANAQSFGTRVEANIPFDFTIGKKTFKAGNYDLSLVGSHMGVYSVSLIDENGRSIYRTIALRNGSTAKKGSEMVFAVVGGEHILETIRTPDLGYSFNSSRRDKEVAQVQRISVPTSGPQF